MKEKVVILGSGESGIGAATLAVKQGYEVFLSDYGLIAGAQKAALDKLGIEYEEGMHTISKMADAVWVVKSPGIPDKAPIVRELNAMSIEVISEIEFAFRFVKPNAKIIAITGTNGKTTTTLLTWHLLREAGWKVGLGGNVGYSFALRVAEDDYDYYVLEVSSFQLDGIIHFRPDVAVLLNITPDHLDRYEYDFASYVASKFRITENLRATDYFIYSADSKPIVDELQKRPVAFHRLSVSTETTGAKTGAFLSGEHLSFSVSIPALHWHQSFSCKEIPLLGRHNMTNTMAAVLAVRMMGLADEQIAAGLKTFVNAPHRLEEVASIGGVRYINDSKATNVDSVFYALDGIQAPIIWIAGGIDKGNDYSFIEALVETKVKGLICLGKDNRALTGYFAEKIGQIAETVSIDEAVSLAFEWAESGDVVLLSPACASFDLFRNYEDRGDQFKRAVVDFKTKKIQPV